MGYGPSRSPVLEGLFNLCKFRKETTHGGKVMYRTFIDRWHRLLREYLVGDEIGFGMASRSKYPLAMAIGT